MPENSLPSGTENAALLDTLMYVIPSDTVDGRSVYQIVDELSNPAEGDTSYEAREIRVLKAAMATNADYWRQVRVSHMSWQTPGCDPGTCAATFVDGAGDITVAFRGTGDGEWLDNAVAYAGDNSLQQQRAMEYFDRVFEDYIKDRISDPSVELTITGHSKGGNKAQYVMLTSQYGQHIDACLSFDGQGFSPEAIQRMMRDPAYYNAQLEKMYSICGENDFVNVLGAQQVFLDGHTSYIQTPGASGFGDYHEISTLFDGGALHEQVDEQGSFANYARVLSQSIAQLPYKEREECARFIMQLLEMKEDWKTAYDGETGWMDLFGFLAHGLPIVLKTAVGTKEGRVFFSELLGKAIASVYEEKGIWGVVGLFFVTALILPRVLPGLIVLVGDILILANIVDTFLHFADFVEKAVAVAKDALQKIGDAVITFAGNVVDWGKAMVGKLGEGLARLFSQGKGKLLAVVREFAELSGKISGIMALYSTQIMLLNRAVSLAGDVEGVFGEAYVKSACRAVSVEARQTLTLIRGSDNELQRLKRLLDVARDMYIRIDQSQARGIQQWAAMVT